MLDLALPRLRFQLLIVGIQYLGFSSQSDTNFHNSKPIVGFELLEITPIHEHPNQLFVTWFKFFHSVPHFETLRPSLFLCVPLDIISRNIPFKMWGVVNLLSVFFMSSPLVYRINRTLMIAKLPL